jgi:hypothetical protein
VGTPPTTPRERVALAFVLLLGLALQLPSLGVGFFADDYVHQLVLADTGGTLPIPRWSLYDFGSAAEWAELEGERGALPWWTASDWKIRFFRPLTSLSIWADHALWGGNALGYHATNLALWLALLVLAHRLYLAFGLERGGATLALFVFVLSDASSVPVGWIANRNSLLEALGAAAATWAALRGRAWLALGFALAAALSKESGALALPLVAWILWHRNARGGALVGLALFVAHLAFLALAGYGTKSLFYATPWSEPGRYLWNALTMLSGGLLALLGPLPLDVVTLVPHAQLGLVALGIGLGWPLAAWLVRRVPAGRRALPVAWTLLFLVPQGGVAPADRLLFVPSLGAAALLACAWRAERARWDELGRLRRAAVLALATSVTLGSGLYLALQNVDVLPGMARHVRAKALASEVGAPELGGREVLVLQTENAMQAFTLSVTWAVESAERSPAEKSVRFRILQSGGRALRWTRTGEREFELETLARPLLDGPFERVYLSAEGVHAVGTRWRTPLFEVELLAADVDGPRRLRFTCTRALDEPGMLFVRPVEGVLRALAPPAIGTNLELPEVRSTRPFVP